MDKFETNPAAIAALIPVYQENGDVTRLIYQDGTSDIVKLRIRAVIKRIARSYCTDLSLLKKKTAEIAEKSLYNALVFDQSLVLLPTKTRKPRVSGDNTLAFVNLKAIERVLPSPTPPHRSVIQLTGGHTVASFWTTNKINQHILQAQTISQKLIENMPQYQQRKINQPDFTALGQILVDIMTEIARSKMSN